MFGGIVSILKTIKKQDHNKWFAQPVDPVAENLPTYTTIVARPMDLGTISHKIAQGEYDKEDQIVADIRLTFDNAMLFSPDPNPVHVEAKRLLHSFNTKYQALMLNKSKVVETTTEPHVLSDSVTNPQPPSASSTACVPSTPSASNSFDLSQLSELQQCAYIVDELIGLRISHEFRTPVDCSEYVDYPAVVKIPMDLGTIQSKLRENKYQDKAQVAADMELIWNNCLLYNGVAHPITAKAIKIRDKFQALFQCIGVNGSNLSEIVAKRQHSKSSKKKPDKGAKKHLPRSSEPDFAQPVPIPMALLDTDVSVGKPKADAPALAPPADTVKSKDKVRKKKVKRNVPPLTAYQRRYLIEQCYGKRPPATNPFRPAQALSAVESPAAASAKAIEIAPPSGLLRPEGSVVRLDMHWQVRPRTTKKIGLHSPKLAKGFDRIDEEGDLSDQSKPNVNSKRKRKDLPESTEEPNPKRCLTNG